MGNHYFEHRNAEKEYSEIVKIAADADTGEVKQKISLNPSRLTLNG